MEQHDGEEEVEATKEERWMDHEKGRKNLALVVTVDWVVLREEGEMKPHSHITCFSQVVKHASQ